jgi:hypothetical protein
MTCCSTPTEVSPFTGGAALAWDGESWSPWSAEEARGCTCTSWLRERGLLPHPLSAERDEAVASLLWRVHASATAETPE